MKDFAVGTCSSAGGSLHSWMCKADALHYSGSILLNAPNFSLFAMLDSRVYAHVSLPRCSQRGCLKLGSLTFVPLLDHVLPKIKYMGICLVIPIFGN